MSLRRLAESTRRAVTRLAIAASVAGALATGGPAWSQPRSPANVAILALPTANTATAATADGPKAERPGDAESSPAAPPTDPPTALPDLVRWGLTSPRLAPSVGEAVRAALDNNLRLGEAEAARLLAPVAAPEPFTLRASRTDRESTDLRRLMETGERWQLTELRATARLPAQDAILSGRGQVAQLPGMPQAPGTSTGEALEDPLLLDLRLRLDDFEAGASHRAFGKRLERAMTVPGMRPDQEGSEIWLARQLGLVRLKVARSELSDNVDRNPALSRTKRTQTSLTGELQPPGWPVLALTLARGEAERSWLAGARAGAAPESQSFDSVTGSLSYGGDGWDLWSSTTLTRSRDAAGSADAATSLYHDLVVTLRLVDGLTLAPALSTGLDRYERGGIQTTTTGSANVTLSYQLPADWRTWTYAGYTASRSNDKSVDGRSITLTGGLSRDLGPMLGGRGSVSLEAGHRTYTDALYPEGSARETFAYLLFRLARF